MATILVVDDDPHLREVVCFALERDGFTTVQAADGRAALVAFDEHAPALLVLDIMMPELNGTEVCRQLRQHSRVPIVFLSSRDEELDRILGLELGGDDYITKPFSPRELVARVRAVLRRLEVTAAPAAASDAAVIRHGRLQVDHERYAVRWDDVELTLTTTEFGIVRTLCRRPGKVYSRDALMDAAYEGQRIVSDRTIDSHVRRVRRKFADLGATPIETVHGVGYKLGRCD